MQTISVGSPREAKEESIIIIIIIIILQCNAPMI